MRQFLLSLCKLSGALRRRGGNATTSLEFEYLHRKSGRELEMLIGEDDVSNDVITLVTCFT